MRHEKISLADHAILPGSLVKDGVGQGGDEAEEKDDKGPPVAIQHFHFCGRMPSRHRKEAALPAAAGKAIKKRG